MDVPHVWGHNSETKGQIKNLKTCGLSKWPPPTKGMPYSWVRNVSIEKTRDNRKTGYKNIILETRTFGSSLHLNKVSFDWKNFQVQSSDYDFLQSFGCLMRQFWVTLLPIPKPPFVKGEEHLESVFNWIKRDHRLYGLLFIPPFYSKWYFFIEMALRNRLKSTLL